MIAVYMDTQEREDRCKIEICKSFGMCFLFCSRYEAELKAAELAAEEDEERLRELERQAEEEAFQRLLDEKDAAEEKRLQLEIQARQMREEEERMA